MSKRNDDLYKNILIDLADQLKKELRREGTSSAETDLDQPAHSVPRGATDHRYRQVLAAINRISQGEYGVCQACRRNIDLERLEIIPEAALCINCQRAKERRLDETVAALRLPPEHFGKTL